MCKEVIEIGYDGYGKTHFLRHPDGAVVCKCGNDAFYVVSVPNEYRTEISCTKCRSGATIHEG